MCWRSRLSNCRCLMSCAAAETDVHCRTAENNQLRADDNFALLHVFAANVADSARQHNGLMVAAQLFAVVAGYLLFIGTEIAVERRTTCCLLIKTTPR